MNTHNVVKAPVHTYSYQHPQTDLVQDTLHFTSNECSQPLKQHKSVCMSMHGSTTDTVQGHTTHVSNAPHHHSTWDAVGVCVCVCSPEVRLAALLQKQGVVNKGRDVQVSLGGKHLTCTNKHSCIERLNCIYVCMYICTYFTK